MSRDPEHLAERFLAGEPAAARQLEHWARGAATPFRTRLGDEVDDLVQEVLTRLLTALGRGEFRGEASVRTYLKRMIANAAVDRLRSRQTWRWVELGDLSAVAEAGILERLMSRQGSLELLRLAARLPSECHDLWRRIIAGESYREMSRATGLSEEALRVRVYRCRKRALTLRTEGSGTVDAAAEVGER